MQAKRIRQTILISLAAVLGLWLFFMLLFPILLPFFIGLLFAWIAQKPIAFLQEKLKLPRWLCSFFCVLGIFLSGGVCIFFLCKLGCKELMSLVRELPQLAQSLSAPLANLQDRLYAIADRLPDGIGSGFRAGLESFFQSGAMIGSKVYDWLFSFASGLFSKLPDIILFTFTSVLASFMLASQLPKISALFQKKLPQQWHLRIKNVSLHLKKTLGGWIKAQLKLMGITFLILTIGLMILNFRYPFVLGLIVTIVDALPILGVGTILLPWGLLMFLRGNTRCGIGLIILYGAAAITRQTLEPRMIGKQIGLSPILTLLALYTGYRCAGIWGMILFPICAILLKQFWDHAQPKKYL